MSLENCSLPRPGADLKGVGMKIPFSPRSLLLEPTRVCLCPWLAAQPSTARRCWDVPTPAALHQDGPAGVQRAQPMTPRPGLSCRQPSKRALTSLAQGWEPEWCFTGPCGAGRPGHGTREAGLGMGKGTKWAVLAQCSPECVPRLSYLQTASRTELLVSLEDFFLIITLCSCFKSRNEFLLIPGTKGGLSPR